MTNLVNRTISLFQIVQREYVFTDSTIYSASCMVACRRRHWHIFSNDLQYACSGFVLKEKYANKGMLILVVLLSRVALELLLNMGCSDHFTNMRVYEPLLLSSIHLLDPP
jgi:hypothetical protein